MSCPNVEGIQRGSLFGGDTGVDCIEAVSVYGVKQIVEKSDSVYSLNLYHGKPWIALVVNIGPHREGDGVVIGITKKVLLNLEIGLRVIILVMI